MDLFFNGPLEGLHVYLWVAAICTGVGVHVARLSERSLAAVVEGASVLVVAIAGFIGMTSAAIHLGWPGPIAQSIGWAPSPFQTEVAFANLALGSIAAGSLRWRAWQVPAIVGKTIFMWGAALTHVRSWLEHGNTAYNNTGPILWWDIFLPVAMIGLYAWHRRLGVTGTL